MSAPPDRSRSAKHTLRTRLLMVGVFVGAIVALSLTWAMAWDGGGRQADDGPTEPKAKVAAFHAPTGSCLAWDRPNADDARTVPCEQPHRFEITGVVDVADQFPKNAPAPNLEQWRQLAQQRCFDGAAAYLGKPLDPYGKLTVGVLRPDNRQWSQGDRQLRCGLQWAGPGGQLQQLRGPAAEQDQSNAWEPGTCLALAGKSVGDPIDCARPHAYEIVAQLDLAREFEDDYPDQDEQKQWLDTECATAVREYTDGASLEDRNLILTWDLREQESWDAGSTLVNCKVGAKLPDDSGLAPVTGSVRRGDAAPTDQPPAVSTTPPQPSSTGSTSSSAPSGGTSSTRQTTTSSGSR